MLDFSDLLVAVSVGVALLFFAAALILMIGLGGL
jgi:hypothetical protein